MTDKQMHWALRRVAFWALFLIAQYCLVAGFAWRWVLGLTFPLWKLLVIGAIQGFCAFLGSAIFPRAKRAPEDGEDAGAPANAATDPPRPSSTTGGATTSSATPCGLETLTPRATPSEVYLHRKADWESAEKARTKKTGSAVDVERLR